MSVDFHPGFIDFDVHQFSDVKKQKLVPKVR